MKRFVAMSFVVATRALYAAPDAVLILSSSQPESQATGRMLAVVKQQLGSKWHLVNASGLFELARVDPLCSEGPEKKAKEDEVLADVREGLRLFFEETALDQSRQRLASATTTFFDHPCLFGGDKAARMELCSAAVVLARILLPSEPESAAMVARRIALVFDAEEVSAQDVPPEIARFFKGIRSDIETTRTTLEVVAQPEGSYQGATLYVDGREVTGGWKTMVSAGSHEVTLRLKDGVALSRHVVTGDLAVRIEFDVMLAGALTTGQEGCLVVGGPRAQDPVPIARRIAEATGLDAILARENPDGGLSVVVVTRSGPIPELMAVQTESARAISITMPPDSPIAERAPWPWPYVTMGISAALLAAGVGLNIGANDAAAAINDGENRLPQWRAMRYSSIACYSLAAAGAVSTVLLFVLRPPPKTHLLIEDSGF